MEQPDYSLYLALMSGSGMLCGMVVWAVMASRVGTRDLKIADLTGTLTGLATALQLAQEKLLDNKKTK